MIYVIGCGKNKLSKKSYAKDMYTGSLFKLALRYASNRIGKNRIFIISAKYGLIKLDKIIAPYNEKMGVNASITIDQVKVQAFDLGIMDSPVTILASAKYCEFLNQVFKKEIILPLKGLSLGYSLQFLKRNSK